MEPVVQGQAEPELRCERRRECKGELVVAGLRLRGKQIKGSVSSSFVWADGGTRK